MTKKQKQAVVNHVYEEINKPDYHPGFDRGSGQCRYRTFFGGRCHVGLLLGDSSPAVFHRGGVASLLSSHPGCLKDWGATGSPTDVAFLRRLQRTHDDAAETQGEMWYRIDPKSVIDGQRTKLAQPDLKTALLLGLESLCKYYELNFPTS